MPNTNFQTFHQMGQAINEVVRQATGRDAVQNIDMDHVTVAQNHYYEEVTLSASRVSFTDRVGNTPLEKCVVQIEPVQDLHGYSKPWPAGGGKNLYPVRIENDAISTNANGSFIIDSGEVVVSTTNAGASNTGIFFNSITMTTPSSFCRLVSELESPFVISFDAMSEDGVTLRYGFSNSLTFYKQLTRSWQRVSCSFDTAQSFPFCFYMANAVANTSMRIRNVQIEIGTTATNYEPYSNICPITGWTGVNIHVSPTTDAQDGETYSITFPSEAGTVYGGTLTVNADESGTLVVDRVSAQIPSADILYASSALAGRYFTRQNYFSNLKNGSELLCNAFLGLSTANSRDMGVVYISAGQVIFNTPFDTLENFKAWIDANLISIVYELATPQTYTLTTEQIKTIQGQNHIWADTGNIEVTIKVLKELY